MRETKYRLWDKLANKMVTAPSYWSITLDGKVFYGNADMSETVVLMQDTGLKDKNGEKIHEGDILGNGKVVWSELSCAFFVEGKDSKNTVNYTSKEFEIIGNIYENPELLNN